MLSSVIMKNENRIAMHVSMVVGRRGDNVWGRAYGPGMMIVESAPTLAKVKSKMKKAIEKDGVSKVQGFDLEYDLSSLFHRFPFLVASGIGKRARIREGRLKLYANGSRNASAGNVKAPEAVIRKLGKQLAAIELQIPEHKKFAGKDVLSNYIPWFIAVDDYMRSLGPHQMFSSNRKKREPPDPSEDQEWERELPADVF